MGYRYPCSNRPRCLSQASLRLVLEVVEVEGVLVEVLEVVLVQQLVEVLEVVLVQQLVEVAHLVLEVLEVLAHLVLQQPTQQPSGSPWPSAPCASLPSS